MAFSVNRASILGRAGRDAEVRYTQGGKAVARMSIATSERNGKGEDVTEWHNVTAWDKLAELCGRLVKKGGQVYVEGRIQTRKYVDKDGNQRRSTEIIAREMVFLSASGDGASGGSRRDERGGQSGSYGGGYSGPTGDGYGHIEDEDDSSIPF